MNHNLIALYSPAMGHGKGAVCETLHQHGFQTIKMAGTIKTMVRAFLSDYGLTTEQIERYVEGDLKEQAIPALPGITSRHLMQTLGTDWGRTLVHQDIWIRLAMGRITRALEAGGKVVVDDMRFANEYDALFELGAVMTKVVRPGVRATNGHASEGLLNLHYWHAEITNDGTLEQLQAATLDTLVLASK